MHQIILGLTETQRYSLNKLKKETEKPVTVLIREAIDEYLKKPEIKQFLNKK